MGARDDRSSALGARPTVVQTDTFARASRAGRIDCVPVRTKKIQEVDQDAVTSVTVTLQNGQLSPYEELHAVRDDC